MEAGFGSMLKPKCLSHSPGSARRHGLKSSPNWQILLGMKSAFNCLAVVKFTGLCRSQTTGHYGPVVPQHSGLRLQAGICLFSLCALCFQMFCLNLQKKIFFCGFDHLLSVWSVAEWSFHWTKCFTVSTRTLSWFRNSDVCSILDLKRFSTVPRNVYEDALWFGIYDKENWIFGLSVKSQDSSSLLFHGLLQNWSYTSLGSGLYLGESLSFFCQCPLFWGWQHNHIVINKMSCPVMYPKKKIFYVNQ